ncbi:VPS9 domain-containing protein [Xylariaceae sp. FL0594]|nr:VPS9 domain-containing protein [Xylariaceae sp. FL0594]
MQILNPYLAAFFKPGNSATTHCTPIHHHILLVPTTEFLLTSRELESELPVSDTVAAYDFLASHVLRVPSPSFASAGGRDGVGNLREWRGKAKQYTTLNGRTVVIKDSFVYSNKGFRTHAQAQLLSDAVWYGDTLEPRQWLIYYISRPLVGIWEEVEVPQALFVEGVAKLQASEASRAAAAENGEPSLPRKKDIKSFPDLLRNFPVIDRQMEPGLQKLFAEFKTIFDKPLPPPPSATHIPDPLPDGPIATAMKKVRAGSVPGRRASVGDDRDGARVAENFFAEDDEDVMRASLETAITTAIDLFQKVDMGQLSLLGATTDLTGPLVERLIERFVAETAHGLIWPRLVVLRRPQDQELEAKIRQMEYIDISQLGIFIEGGLRKKRELVARLGQAVDEFRKMSGATCAQSMMDILLATIRAATQIASEPDPGGDAKPSSEKSTLTINADTLVSLLLFIVIRAGVKNLQARLLYMRHFIFIDDVESGEMGYALSTFEAVISYLFGDSSSLRRASRRNKALWNATARGDMHELRRILDADSAAVEEGGSDASSISSQGPSVNWSMFKGSGASSSSIAPLELYSQGSGLGHVFPFQNKSPVDAPKSPVKKVKKVSMDTRSMSSGSEYSYHSRSGSIVTLGSGLEGDTSVERLCQTQDAFGGSIPMMAIQNERPEALRYLLSLEEYFPKHRILEDTDNQDTTLLSAAIQLGHTELIDIILDFVMASTPEAEIRRYFALQDVRGRSIGHYLFHAPSLITRIGHLVPWRQKDKNGQTPLFALFRSYDHADYDDMVRAGLQAASTAQADGQPLHLDDHVDCKGNTLLHIVTDPQLAAEMLLHCDVDVNATNEKKFTALMVASKYGRFDMVRALYSDPRVDVAARELRGLTAVELAKDDEVRNRIDDLALFNMHPGVDGRVTGVVRSFFVEDATIRLVIKSAAPADANTYTVTTCRRSLADFEHLASLLSMENPASWIPKVSGQRYPFQIPSRPSRSLLKDTQIRMDAFLKIMLSHPTFSTHEMLWEFFLVPDLQADMMEQRSRLKAETRIERIRDEFEPLEDTREVEQFVYHARDMVRAVNHGTKTVARRVNNVVIATSDLYDAARLLQRHVSRLAFPPSTHISAMETYINTLVPPFTNPAQNFHSTVLALQSTIQSMLTSLSAPLHLIGKISTARKSMERNYNSVSRSSRWPLGLLDETRQRLNEEREERARRAQFEVDELSKELRYTQQTVAGELAGWQEMHARLGRQAIREFARGMLVLERERLNGVRRALRKIKEHDGNSGSVSGSGPAMAIAREAEAEAEASNSGAEASGSWHAQTERERERISEHGGSTDASSSSGEQEVLDGVAKV